jgi:hypothetical protein
MVSKPVLSAFLFSREFQLVAVFGPEVILQNLPTSRVETAVLTRQAVLYGKVRVTS